MNAPFPRRLRAYLQTSPRVRVAAMALVAVSIATLAYPCARCAFNMSYATLGRDTGIYQFVAWAMNHGQRPYVDIRENNGPLIYLFHEAYLALGGADERVVRVADMSVQAAAYVIAGVVAYGPWSSPTPTRRQEAIGRAAFAALGLLVLLSQYFVYDWWGTAQRESTYDAVLLAGLALQLRAHQRLAAAEDGVPAARGIVALLVASGALVGATWFGKPTYLACTAAQVACVVLDPTARQRSRRVLLALGAGAVASATFFVCWIAVHGDLAAYVRIVILEAPTYYVPVWRQTLESCYTLGHNGPLVNLGAVTLVTLGALWAAKVLPRSFAIGLVPVAFGLASFFAQRKGFLYHLHPVTAGAHFAWVMFLGWACDRLRAPRPAWLIVAFALVWGLVLAQCFGDATVTDYYDAEWMPAGERPDTRETPGFYHSFHARDFDGWEVRRAAKFLAAHTPKDGAVQVYGIEPYILFLAERRTATPYIYAYDLNMDPALEGGPGGKPGAADAARIRELQARNAADFDARLRAHPPSAFVLIDSAPMAYAPDALADLRSHCARAAEFVDARYEEVARFATLRVFLPKAR